MNILLPYMARWHTLNWTRYHSLAYALAEKGNKLVVLQPPGLVSEETNFQEIDGFDHPNLELVEVSIPAWLWQLKVPFEKLVKKLFSNRQM